MDRYDLLIIGSGVAGTTAAKFCSQEGWKVAVVDYREFGGTCPLRGCDPKRIITSAAGILEESRRLTGKGIAEPARLDWRALMDFKRGFTEPFPGEEVSQLTGMGIDVIHGLARFESPDSIQVDGKSINPRRVLIASGSMPRPLGFPGGHLVSDNEKFLNLESLPPRIVFVGGGYISFEFAHAAARAGAECTILHLDDRPLPDFEKDLVDLLIKESRDAGIEILLNHPVEAIEETKGELVVHSGKTEIHANLAVHGAGRVPEIQELDLDAGRVERDHDGIKVNEYLQSVSNRFVYAAGDATGGEPKLTPVAKREGVTAARNLIFGNEYKLELKGLASVVFTHPPLGMVGLTENDCKQKRLPCRVISGETSDWFNSRRRNVRHSGYKILLEETTGRILGAHVFGPGADEIINIFSVAVEADLTAEEVAEIPMAYPTAASDIEYMLEG